MTAWEIYQWLLDNPNLHMDRTSQELANMLEADLDEVRKARRAADRFLQS